MNAMAPTARSKSPTHEPQETSGVRARAQAQDKPQAAHDLLMVDGMFCGGCAATLEHRLAALPSVEEAAVDLAAGAALLRWRPGLADPEAARRLITDLGYQTRSAGDSAQGAAAAGDAARMLQIRLAVALFFGMWTMLPSIALYIDAAPTAGVAHGLAWAAAIASFPVVLFSGRPFYAMATSTLRAGAAGIDALVSLGVLGALVLSMASMLRGGAEVYFEVAVALITLQLLARLMELRAARAGRDAVARLLDLAPPRVMRLDADERGRLVPVSAVKTGDVLVAEAGDTLPVDGTLLDARAWLDRSLLTGESQMMAVSGGSAVHAGEIVAEGPLRLRVTAAAGERRIDALARQARATLMHKPAWQRSIDVVARYFLLLATLASAVGAIVATLQGGDAAAIAERALTVFVIACPCALSLAAPVVGLGASRRAADVGMLLRDLRAVTSAARIDVLFVDKTGTLTQGTPTVRAIHPQPGVDANDVLEVAALAEAHARHPLAAGIVAAARSRGADLRGAPDALRRTFPGKGVLLQSADVCIRVGNQGWLIEEGLDCPPYAWAEKHEYSRVWVALDDRVLGAIDLDDPLRPGAAAAVQALGNAGLEVIMLSGDGDGAVAEAATRLGIEGFARCTPEDKVAHIEAAQARGQRAAFLGDGLNDGPAIAAADLGIAVEGALDAARTASAVTLLRGGVERVPELLRLTSSAGRILRQNIGWAIAYNALAVPAAVLGWVHPAVAAVAMALSSITVVMNSLRISAAGGAGAVSSRRPQGPQGLVGSA